MRACAKILAGLFLIALVSSVLCGVYWLFGGGRSFWDLRGTIDVVVFDPLARWIALGGRDVGTAQYQDRGDVKLCDPRTGKVLRTIVLPSRPWGMAANHDGTLLAMYSVMTGNSYSVDVFAIPPDGTPVKAHTQTLSFPSQDVFGFVGTHLVCAGKEMLAVLNTGDWTVATEVNSCKHRPVLDPSSDRIAWGQEINGQLAVLLWQAGGNPTQLAGARVPLAFLPDGRLVVVLSQEAGGLGVWPESQVGQYEAVPESQGEWSGSCVSQDGQSFAAWSSDGSIRVWKLGTEGITVAGRLSIPRLRYVRFAPVPDILALATTAQNADGSWDTASYARLEGSGLWSIGQNKRVLWFADRDMLIQGQFLVEYLSGLESVSVWDISNLARPRLLWRDEWRQGGALFE